MKGNTKQEEKLVQNLQDAGCSHSFVEQFMEIHNSKNTVQQIRMLSQYRTSVLESVHESQTRLDCLDFLIFQLKKPQDAP